MANRTVKDAKSVRGTNPQYLVEKIIRSRIYDSQYWKEECFALSAELLVDKAMELRFIGGVYGGNIKPTPFLCLTLKMLQIQPEKDIIVEFIKNEEFKYVRALGAFYMRLVGTSVDCYKYLEPLFNDGRKLRRQNREGTFELIHVDEFIDELLREERIFDIILPRIQKRHILEESNEIQQKISALEDDLDDGVESSAEEEEEEYDLPLIKTASFIGDHRLKRRVERVRSFSRRSPDRKERDRRNRERGRYVEPSRNRDIRRHRSKSPGPRHRSKSPGPRHRSKSPGLRHRSKSPGPRHRSKSPGPKHRSKSPVPRHRQEDRRREDERENERRRSPTFRNRSVERDRVKDREKRHKEKSKDKGERNRERERYRERSRSRERRYRSKSPLARHTKRR